MCAHYKNDSLKLKDLILNAKQPIILRNFKQQWKCCEQTLKEWCDDFDELSAGIEFEKMPKYSGTGHPQWERERKKVKLTMKQFLEHNETKEHWLALNYQTPDEIPLKCKKNVDFSCFGFPDLTKDFARFWLSTPNANTPCHRDTYGCNIVVQVFGSKQWLLFPPHAALTATRVPYEESSVYCTENFYAPDINQINDLKRLENDAYIYTLEAGNVLIVPRAWWHFVETKTTALSINAWIPLDIDKHAQLEECIVKYIIETIARQESTEVVNHMLNPNQKEISPEAETLNILAFLATIINSKDDNAGSSHAEIQSYPYQYLDETEFKHLLSEFPNAFLIPKSCSLDFHLLILENSKRHTKNDAEVTPNPINHIKEALINSLCADTVLKETVREFTKRLKS